MCVGEDLKSERRTGEEEGADSTNQLPASLRSGRGSERGACGKEDNNEKISLASVLIRGFSLTESVVSRCGPAVRR